MPLIKSSLNTQETTPTYSTINECIKIILESPNTQNKSVAISELIKFKDGPQKLVWLLKEGKIVDKALISHASALLAKLDPKSAPIDEVLELLKVEDAFVRNHAISILQDYGNEIKYYIIKYLIGNNRDLRIFAINVLGDVNFSESREMLLDLLKNEQDVNVAMTAVDYFREIGMPEDIPFLESLKERFKNEPYAIFAISKTIEAIKG